MSELPNRWKEAVADTYVEHQPRDAGRVGWMCSCTWVHPQLSIESVTPADAARAFALHQAEMVLAALLAVPARQTVCEMCEGECLIIRGPDLGDPNDCWPCPSCGGLGFIDSESIGEVLGAEWEQVGWRAPAGFYENLGRIPDASVKEFGWEPVYRRVSKGSD